MIVLDTNVVSEAMKPAPDEQVRDWLNRQASQTLYLSSVTLAELLYGIAVLPEGKRKNRLKQALDGLLALFGGRVLPFDTESARCHAALAVRARQSGQGFPLPDSYIAAVASAHRFAVASRDVSAFAAAGLNVINPWLALPVP